ncbi:hypothetical protein [Fodinibius salsisoli]|uniref:NADH-quinone oxidoreductase subunit D domain-containing protein n=1 Tax=Fodinibius salsisoli TaxID=2820877 RepID=A0ABT3PKD8_9BACT|nr:hypothetical protein [Fodinibius salsisoli]MCW9706228.1 hypothetical protein [Fodinibius salsisoli]
MTESVMKYGARKGRMSWLRRWIARASAKNICIFPVPGADILRYYQKNMQLNCTIAANPREANVLLVMGEMTEALALNAGVAYQQIPRPRVLVFAGPVQLPYLPEPDVQISLSNGFIDEALPQIRQRLKNQAWSENAEPWVPDFLSEMLEDSGNGGHDHHNHDHDNGGQKDDPHNHNGHNHSEHNHEGHEDHNSETGHNHDHEHNHEGDHEGGGHDHGDMDFMSMVAMTKDLPRPKDGLPMNRSDVHFGPFHPGLPGGLSVFMELDGDTVIEANIENDLTARSLDDLMLLEAKQLPDTLARFNPLMPESYRLLARKALLNASDDKSTTTFSSAELIQLESERIGSHLNWLATFAKTLGNEWLHQESARWHAAHRSEDMAPEKLLAFLEQIRTMPYLKTKLSVGGLIPDKLLHHLSGPAAKATGKLEDARSSNEQYLSLDWAPITNTENNAWGRLLMRLEEIEQSLELINKARRQESKTNDLSFSGSGERTAKLESPRGTLSLHITVENGKVTRVQIETPSKPLAALVPTLTEEEELSDALVQIASLDISPWEIELKGAGGE